VISEQEVSEYFHLRLRGFDSRDGLEGPLGDRRSAVSRRTPAGLRLKDFAEEIHNRGVRGSFGGLGFPRGGGMAEITWSAGTRRACLPKPRRRQVRRPTLPFLKAPLGPRAISTVCSRYPPSPRLRRAGAATGAPSWPSTAT
jgi:hypothetical protein